MLGVVIVNYRSNALTSRFVREELPHIRIPYVTVIVDNRGNNVGMEYLSKHYDIDYFLFTNNDIHFQSPDVVDELVKKLESDPSIGIIGPEIIGLDGKRQSPEPYISLWDKYVWVYLSTPFLSREKKAEWFRFGYSEQAEEGTHYKLMGSFLICRRTDIEAAGGFDPNTFLYAEETILSERMKRIGKSLYFYPAVTVVHEHGATISSYLSNVAMARQQFRSDAYYYRAYKGVSRLSVWLAKVLYDCILLVRRRLFRPDDSRGVDIIPYAGLCNRMRVMASAYACARELGYSARVLWCGCNKDCKVRFDSLFQPVTQPDLTVVETNALYSETSSKRHLYLPSILRRLRYERVYANFNFRNPGNRPSLREKALCNLFDASVRTQLSAAAFVPPRGGDRGAGKSAVPGWRAGNRRPHPTD